jgi:tRNA pseudouridine55 synthase
VLLPVETVLDGIPALAVTETQAQLLSNGGFLPASALSNGVYQAKADDRLAAIVRVLDGQIRPVRVINRHNLGEYDVDYSRT